jgi:hypothetical protein
MYARLACIEYVACPHVLRVMLDNLETYVRVLRTCVPSYTVRVMLGILETCVRALGTCVTSCTGRTASLFFMFEARDPQVAMGHVTASEPTSAGRRDPKP